jgi:nitroreductase
MKGLSPLAFLRGLRELLRGRIDVPPSLEDNPVLQVLLRRRSIRRFRRRTIPDEVLRAILEAGRVAPSTVNLQSWSFGVFSAGGWREVFERDMPFDGDRAVIVLGDMHRVRTAVPELPHRPLVEYTLAVINASIAAYAMNVAAEACGVASVMLSETGRTGFYDALYLKERLQLPDGVFPLLTLVLGYPARSAPGLPPKLPVEEVTFQGVYEPPNPQVLASWLTQMMAGYRATRITDSLKAQLRRYVRHIDQAEEGLERVVFYGSPPGEEGPS